MSKTEAKMTQGIRTSGGMLTETGTLGEDQVLRDEELKHLVLHKLSLRSRKTSKPRCR